MQSFERGDGFSQLPHHVAVYVMAHEVQQDDVVLGGSLQPAHELPQLVRPQLPEAWCFVFQIDFPVLPGIFSQVQLTRELLTGSGVKRKLQVVFEGHVIWNRTGDEVLTLNGAGAVGCGSQGSESRRLIVSVQVCDSDYTTIILLVVLEYLPFKLGMAKIFNMAKMFLVPFLFEKSDYVP